MENFSGEMSLSAATFRMSKICRVVSEPVWLIKEKTKVTWPVLKTNTENWDVLAVAKNKNSNQLE